MVKATGIVKNIDNMGRLTLPKEVREHHGFDFSQPVEIFISDDGAIILRKYQPGCIFCENVDEEYLLNFKDKTVCRPCMESLTASA